MRLTAAIPVLFSLPSFIILIILAASGMQPNTKDEMYALQLNTSRVANNIVTFSPSANSTTGAMGTAAPKPAFNNTGPLGQIINGASGLINGALTQISTTVDSALQSLENSTITELKSLVGVQDAYRVYFRTVCQGSYADHTDASTLDIKSCSKYTSAPAGIQNLSSGLPSKIDVLGTTISSPLLSDSMSTLPAVGMAISVGTTLNFVLLVFAIVGSGLTALVSAAAIVFSPNWLVLVLIALSTLAPTCLMVNTLIVTVVGPFLASILGSLEGGLSITVNAGSQAVAITWASLVLTTLSAVYWVVVWFFSTRSWVLMRVEREMDQAGRPVATLYATYRNLVFVNKRATLVGPAAAAAAKIGAAESWVPPHRQVAPSMYGDRASYDERPKYMYGGEDDSYDSRGSHYSYGERGVVRSSYGVEEDAGSTRNSSRSSARSSARTPAYVEKVRSSEAYEFSGTYNEKH